VVRRRIEEMLVWLIFRISQLIPASAMSGGGVNPSVVAL